VAQKKELWRWRAACHPVETEARRIDRAQSFNRAVVPRLCAKFFPRRADGAGNIVKTSLPATRLEGSILQVAYGFGHREQESAKGQDDLRL
jgi:hypothetical protein